MGVDAARFIAERLQEHGPALPLIVTPDFYGVNSIRDYAWHLTNYPRGWAVILTPRLIASRPLWTRWTVPLEIASASATVTEDLTRDVLTALHGTPRNPTGIQHDGEALSGRDGQGFKYTLLLTVTLNRQLNPLSV